MLLVQRVGELLDVRVPLLRPDLHLLHLRGEVLERRVVDVSKPFCNLCHRRFCVVHAAVDALPELLLLLLVSPHRTWFAKDWRTLMGRGSTVGVATARLAGRSRWLAHSSRLLRWAADVDGGC